MEPNWKVAKYKSKVDAIGAMLELISKTPGCAGLDGQVGMMIFGTLITITPKKKKEQE